MLWFSLKSKQKWCWNSSVIFEVFLSMWSINNLQQWQINSSCITGTIWWMRPIKLLRGRKRSTSLYLIYLQCNLRSLNSWPFLKMMKSRKLFLKGFLGYGLLYIDDVLLPCWSCLNKIVKNLVVSVILPLSPLKAIDPLCFQTDCSGYNQCWNRDDGSS